MAKTQLLHDATASRRATLDLFTWAEKLQFAYAWMSADQNAGSPWRAFPFKKLECGVVGLQFAGTDVVVLETLHKRRPGRVRVMYETQGTFHPKILVGIRGREARVILGSSNFTRAAFTANYEVNLLLSGSINDTPIADTLSVIAGYFRSVKVRDLDPVLIEAYRASWVKRPKPPRLPKLSSARDARRRVETVDHLDVDWPSYLELLLAQDEREFRNVEGTVRLIPTSSDDNAYLTELRWCRDAFAEHGSLAEMPPATRKVVAGFGDSLGWFGRMGGAGYYKEVINKRVAGLSAALDLIPIDREVSDDVFLRATKQALEIRGVGLGCWTRLVSVKRPDLFLSVNRANKKRLRQVFGSAPGTPRAYLAFSRSLLELPWASAEPPSELDGDELELWSGRVALLDAIFYEPDT
jgi:hypothetical protein